MKLERDILATLLEHWPVARLATVTPEGHPHVLPLVFVAQERVLYSPLDAKRKARTTLARVRNIEMHGRASLLLDDYSPDWSRLWWVRLDGEAWVERDDLALLDRVARRVEAKYPQYRDLDLAVYAGEPTLLALRWERVVAWTQSGDLSPIREAVAAISGDRSSPSSAG